MTLILWREGCQLNRTNYDARQYQTKKSKWLWTLTLRPLNGAQQSNHTEGRHPLICCIEDQFVLCRRSIPNEFLQIRDIERGNWHFWMRMHHKRDNKEPTSFRVCVPQKLERLRFQLKNSTQLKYVPARIRSLHSDASILRNLTWCPPTPAGKRLRRYPHSKWQRG